MVIFTHVHRNEYTNVNIIKAARVPKDDTVHGSVIG